MKTELAANAEHRRLLAGQLTYTPPILLRCRDRLGNCTTTTAYSSRIGQLRQIVVNKLCTQFKIIF